MVNPDYDEALHDGMESVDGIPAECWVCDRMLAADEPRRLIPLAPNARNEPPFEGLACLGCHQGREQTYVAGAAGAEAPPPVAALPAGEAGYEQAAAASDDIGRHPFRQLR